MNATVSGWFFDAYPLNDKMVFWIKQEKESAVTIRLEDDVWTHSIKTILNSVLFTKDKRISNLVKHCEFKSHYERIIDIARSEILKLLLVYSTKALLLARMIESIYGNNNFCKIRLYNVDPLPA